MGIEYRYLSQRGALQEGAVGPTVEDTLAGYTISAQAVELVPESVARDNVVMPLVCDGETLVCAAVKTDDLMLADKLRFLTAKNVRLVPAPREQIVWAINRHYHRPETSIDLCDSMLAEFTDTAIDATATQAPISDMLRRVRMLPDVGRYLGKGIVEFKKGVKGIEDEEDGLDQTGNGGGGGVFFYVVEEGQRVLVRHRDGTMEVLAGPGRVWRWWKQFTPMAHYVAHPGEFLIVRFRDGRQEHLTGPADIWFDPRIHLSIKREDALPLAAKEAVVVYSRDAAGAVFRRVVQGPTQFVPRPGEWLHTFSWHSSTGGHKGAQKVPNALVFQKLWLMPDQMYHDVGDVRTADDAVLTVRLMIFFELVDIERMLDTTHDPIGDFVNAATSDVVDLVGQHNFESFKHNTHRLNELETYRQLTGRAAQCGYRIGKVVYRGYGAPESLQQMHDQAIAARTKLQLERATEQQAQDLENYRLDSQITRAAKRRTEQGTEVSHDLELANRRQEAELRQREAAQASVWKQRRAEAEARLELRRRQDAEQREHLAALREMGVDLTAYLTQGRADRVIELRGSGVSPHLHLDKNGEPG